MQYQAMNRRSATSVLLGIFTIFVAPSAVNAGNGWESFLGSWAFELPDGNPAWLQISEGQGKAQASLLWSVGSAQRVTDLKLEKGGFSFKRTIRWKPFGNSDDLRIIEKPITARFESGQLALTVIQTSPGESKDETLKLSGKRMPPMPARPDLKNVVFGDPIVLFNGRDLTGWELSNPKKKNGWQVENGELVNETPKQDFSAYGDYGNLRTSRKFDDFRLTLEYNVPANGNSGVYLRGLYEAQVVDRDSKMQGINGPGAIFGRIAPSENAGQPGGQWNRYDLTLVDRHITVVLNDETVIDNQPVVGCTGGGFSADDTQPGPILLQGDHTSVRYRNIVLRPVRKTQK